MNFMFMQHRFNNKLKISSHTYDQKWHETTVDIDIGNKISSCVHYDD